MTVEDITDGRGQLLALVLRGCPSYAGQYGVSFVTDPGLPFQVGVLRHPKGYVVQAHEHPPTPRVIEEMSEVLVMRKGRLRVTLFGDGYQYPSVDLAAGDVMLLIRGGHAFQALEEVEAVEVKQGPYVGKMSDKKYLPTPAPEAPCEPSSSP